MLLPLGLLSQGGGAGGAGFELISTQIISGSSTTSVTFDVSSLASTYKHLQIRMTARSNTTANWADGILMRFNSDTGANYSLHQLQAYQSGGAGLGSSSATSQTSIQAGISTTSLDTADVFSVSIVDILDAFSTTKNKTTRTLGGLYAYVSPSTGSLVNLTSNAWYNTSAITSVALIEERGVNFVAGTRFSLYGVRGA